MDGLTGADIESICKKATLLAIAEFQAGSRVAPFVVLRADFLAVLESDRGSANQLNAGKKSSASGGDSCADAANE
jgi:SpoVK/Ycf46/Vps4 family AAA+-type ATPase